MTSDAEIISFLHRMDSVRGETIVVETTRSRLRSASFLDGRETFWTGERLVPLTLASNEKSAARRFIFHVGFCGSTLLARLLDDPGAALVLKEPQCLADIAGQRHAIMSGDAVARIDTVIDHALGQLGNAVGGGMPVVVKPTNWVNSLLPVLCAPKREVRAVFVSMDPWAFLGAVFRGGRSRIEFCTRLAAQIAAVAPAGDARLRQAIEADDDPLDRAARIVALLHSMQQALFADAMAVNGWGDDCRVDFSELLSQPVAALQKVRSALGLVSAAADHQRSAKVMERHTKDPARVFSAADRRREDEEIERHHGARFDAALEWLSALATP